ncbi:MAG: hypothetical protein Ta2G_08330 [Termitinemataceae bacterium]|nr:MAG: hypothetical protein Ta2G_08330 [Termitinemataceae bacterium]
MTKKCITYCICILAGVLALSVCKEPDVVIPEEVEKSDIKGKIITREIAGGIESGSISTGEYALLADNPDIKFGRDITVIPDGVIINVYGIADITVGNLVVGGILNITDGAKLTATNGTNIITIGLAGGLEWEQPLAPEPIIVGNPKITGTLNVQEGGMLVVNSATGATAIKMAAYDLKNLYAITDPPTVPPDPVEVGISAFASVSGHTISGSGDAITVGANVVTGASESANLKIEYGATIAITYDASNEQVSELMKKITFNVLLSTNAANLSASPSPSIQVESGNCLIADSLATIGSSQLTIERGGIVEFLGNASLATAGNITVNGLLKNTSSAFAPGGDITVGEGGVIETGEAGAFTIPSSKTLSNQGLVIFASDAGTIAINGKFETKNEGKFIVNSWPVLRSLLAGAVVDNELATIEPGVNLEATPAVLSTINNGQNLIIPSGMTLTVAGDDASTTDTKLSVAGTGLLTIDGTLTIKGGSAGSAVLSVAGNSNFAGGGLILLEGGTAEGADASIEVLGTKLKAGLLIDDVQSKYAGKVRISGAFPSGNIYSTPNIAVNASGVKATSAGAVGSP